MQIIILDRKQGQTKPLVLQGWVCVVLTICLFGLPLLLGYFGYQFSSVRDLHTDKTVQVWIDGLQELGVVDDNQFQPATTARAGVAFPHWPALLADVCARSTPDLLSLPSAQVLRAIAADLPFGLHKHGRLLDPAAYLHRTVR